MAEETPPDYYLPLFFTSKTQEIFECVADDQVTEENPCKLIAREKILQDYKDRAAISDFHPARKIVENYPSEELLVVYDVLFKYGQNFYLVTDDEQKNLLLAPPPEEENGEEGPAGGASTVEIDKVRSRLRSPRPWVSLGSENEVETDSPTRPKFQFSVSRERSTFGTPVEFSDATNPANDVDYPPYEDDNTDVKMIEIDKAVQCGSQTNETNTQTDWLCPKNAGVQYESRTNTEEENKQIMQSETLAQVLMEIIPRFELALQENATMDVFVNDFLQLGEEDSVFVSQSNHHLKDYQSFTDLQFSKNKTISDIQWHPTIKGLVAASCIEHLTFYERIDQSTKTLMTPSLILIWSFADPIHPLLMLEAPDDIMCFKFNPTDPNIIAAGCLNGQIVLWDLSPYSERLTNHHSQGHGGAYTNANLNLPVFFNSASTEFSPILQYSAVSSIDKSHRLSINDIQWVPSHIEVGKAGVVYENKQNACSQIITCSPDGSVMFWDTKPNRDTPFHLNNEDTSLFQHLDLSWKPVLKVKMHKVKGTGDYSPVKVLISEVQKRVNKQVILQLSKKEEEDFDFMKKGEAQELEDVDTKFLVATEDGEVVCQDWQPTKDLDTGKTISSPALSCKAAHDGQIHTLQRSPFLKYILLTVGGWTFSLWKHGLDEDPLYHSFAHDVRLTSAYWSPTRSGVFFVGKADGNIDVWDLLDKSHEPFLTQSVSSCPIMSVCPFQVTSKQQLLGVGDEVGTLHILEVPWNLRVASNNEQSIVEAYFEREAQRVQLTNQRKEKRSRGAGGNVTDTNTVPKIEETVSDVEWEEQAKGVYQQYLELEKKILEDLGVFAEDNE